MTYFAVCLFVGGFRSDRPFHQMYVNKYLCFIASALWSKMIAFDRFSFSHYKTYANAQALMKRIAWLYSMNMNTYAL